MQPFDIADPLPRGVTLLEASAGTGKTWTIGALVTRYVAEGVARLDEMLVVTFGRMASQELRERVRVALYVAERALGGEPGAEDDALLRVLRDAPPEEIARRRARLREALAQFDGATIATTHQFCQLVLRGLGVAGDTDPDATLVDDLDDLLVEVVDDTYLRGFARSNERPLFDRATALQIARKVVGDPQARIEPAEVDAGSPAGRRVRFARLIRAELDRRKRRLGILSYDDLLSQLAHALTSADGLARERMRRRWRVVLVDEFQDTDPVQWEVFRRAFTSEEENSVSDRPGEDCADHSTLVLIGDPKQAIYGFRGGDVFTYLDAKEQARTHQTLATNWRSDADLVRSWQAVLGGAALGDEDIVVHDVQAHHVGSRLAGLPPGADAPWRMRVVTRAQLDTTEDRQATVGLARPVIARDVALDIKRLLTSGATFEGRAIEAGDVAVLAHTYRNLEQVQRALRAVGVPCVLSASGSVLTSPAAREWLQVLEAMEQPHRSPRVRAAALTSMIGRTAAQIDADPDAETDRAAALLRRWGDLLGLRGVAAVLEAAVVGGLPERILAFAGGERHLTDLRHVAEILHDVVLRDGHGLTALVAWLRAQVAEDAPGGASPRSRRLDSDAKAVQLATIHASKGLQYPVVYLPFLADRWTQEADLPAFHAPDRSRCVDVGGDPSKDHVARARAEEDGESLRLLYVALTRAQSQVVTWWAPLTTNSASALHRIMLGRRPGEAQVPPTAPVGSDVAVRDRFTQWQEAGGPVWEDADDPPQVLDELRTETSHLGIREFTRTIDTSWKRTSYTALSVAGEERPIATTSETEVAAKDDEPEVPAVLAPRDPAAQVLSPMAELPVGATFGSLVHAVLEEADAQASDLRAELLAHIGEQWGNWPVPGLDHGLLADALELVNTTSLGPLAPTTRLADISRADRLCELDFELPLAGGDAAGRGREAAATLLGQVAPLLRAHLPDGDPMLAYADALDGTALGEQVLRGYLTGSIDVVLRVDDAYLVVDYKTNWLGPPDEPLTAAAYGPSQLAAAMGHSSYPLQALLYAVVLHRFLRWRLPTYEPERHLGGVLYLYLRGMCGPDTPVIDGHPTGVFSWRPPADLVIALSDLLDGAESV